jgi:hypothetical protein
MEGSGRYNIREKWRVADVTISGRNAVCREQEAEQFVK